MRRSGGGGLGFVVAIIGLVIVMLLAAKAWKAVMPTAAQALMPSSAVAGTRGQNANDPPASATRPSGMPDLKEMGQNTDQHIKQVEDAAAKQD
jgi:hypothetical protein